MLEICVSIVCFFEFVIVVLFFFLATEYGAVACTIMSPLGDLNNLLRITYDVIGSSLSVQVDLIFLEPAYSWESECVF